MNKEGTSYTIVFIFIVSFAFVFLLSMTNQVTIERVRLNQEAARQGAVLAAMGVEATGIDEIQSEFQKVSGDDENGLYASVVGGQLVYAREFAGPGLWGTISGVLAVSADMSRIVGLEIVDDNETPGLGGRINEPAFKEQFTGERIPDDGIRIRPPDGDGGADPDDGVVDAITGATRTSESMQVIVNNVLQELRSPEIRGRLEELASKEAMHE